MKTTKKAFTMIELIFVIVILGILSSIAISKMGVTRDDAIITKGRSQVAAIRNAIALAKSTQLMEGKATIYPDTLDSGGTLFQQANNGIKLLDYGVVDKVENGYWHKVSNNKYDFRVMNQNITFTYNPADGTFDCDHTNATCKLLTE